MQVKSRKKLIQTIFVSWLSRIDASLNSLDLLCPYTIHVNVAQRPETIALTLLAKAFFHNHLLRNTMTYIR